MANVYEVILFDLDGTLMDTSKGIFNSVRYAEGQLGLEPISETQLKRFLGPPPVEVYQEIYKMTKECAIEAAKYHRAYSREKAIFEAKIYSGIKEALEELQRRGKRLAVVTLKAEEIAKTILKFYGLSDFFTEIRGMNTEETLTKADLITNVIKMLEVDKKKVVLVGDSIYDYAGAIKAGIDFIPVLYGFGFDSKAEIEDKHVVDIISDPIEIGRIN